jgi:preprotein translocase SecF subunit
MFNIVEKRRLFFIISSIVIALGIGMMVFSTVETGSPFRLSIDFQGGSIYEFQFIEEGATESTIRDVFAENGEDNVIIQQLGGATADFRVVSETELDLAAVTAAVDDLADDSGGVDAEITEESIYLFSFDADAIDIDAVRETFRDNDLTNVFIREVEGADSALFSVVSPVNAADEVVETLDLINETAPLTYEQIATEVISVQIEAEAINEADVTTALDANGVEVTFVQREPYRWSVRGGFEEQQTSDAIIEGLDDIATLDRGSLRVEAVSETIGQEVTQAAFVAVALAAVVITGFIVLAFRQIPNATRYGLCAIAAMVHDVLIVMGVMSLAGFIAGWEIDALFLTAVLTVVGFSVQDSIVVFDRIRENIPKHIGEPYETIVNRSIWETIHRSLATQLNAFFIMIAILVFGGETSRQFIAILFIGLLSGTYSSIFTAVPLLVAWEKGEIPFLKGDEHISTSTAEAEAAA